MKTTHRKSKVIGSQKFTNNATGEIEDMQVISVEDRDFNFHKIWLEHVLVSLDLISNQKTKVAFWILENLDSNNRFVGTQRGIAQKLTVSKTTVNETLKVLVQSNLMIKEQTGVYRINPQVIFRGAFSKRMNVLIQYNEKRQEINVTPKPKTLTSKK